MSLFVQINKEQYIQHNANSSGSWCCQTNLGQTGIRLDTHIIGHGKPHQKCLEQSLKHNPYRMITSIEIPNHTKKNCGEDSFRCKALEIVKAFLNNGCICGEKSS